MGCDLRDEMRKSCAAGGLILWYLGQEGFLIKASDQYILIDAYLSDYVDKNCSREGTVWKRRYPAPIKAEELDFVDYVLCTHEHFDHADPETLKTLAAVNGKAVFIVPEPSAATISAYGIAPDRMIGAKAGDELVFGDIKIIPVPAAHERLNTTGDGYYRELGYLIKVGGITLWHAGDCCVYDGLAEKVGGVDIAMLPINGRDYYRLEKNIIGNMDFAEAVTLSEKIGAKLLIPMHFDLYDVNAVNPAYFVDLIFGKRLRQAFHIFMPGERYVYFK